MFNLNVSIEIHLRPGPNYTFNRKSNRNRDSNELDLGSNEWDLDSNQLDFISNQLDFGSNELESGEDSIISIIGGCVSPSVLSTNGHFTPIIVQELLHVWCQMRVFGPKIIHHDQDETRIVYYQWKVDMNVYRWRPVPTGCLETQEYEVQWHLCSPKSMANEKCYRIM